MSMKALCSAVTVPVLLSVDEELLVFLKSFSRKLAQALEDEEKATSPSSENKKTHGRKAGKKPSVILLFSTCFHSLESTPWHPFFKEGLERGR